MIKRFIVILNVLMAVTAIIVVVLGAYTRLVDAGLGCPDWPTCYGHLWVPNSVEEVNNANANFSDTPVEAHKTWPEQIHRIFASSLGILALLFFAIINAQYCKKNNVRKINSISSLVVLLVSGTLLRVFLGSWIEPFLATIVFVFIANLIYVSRKKTNVNEKYRDTFLLSALLVCLVILQGLFGMWTVTLKLWPQVVTAHLIGGFTTLSLIVLLLFSVMPSSVRFDLRTKFVSNAVLISLLLVSVQIMLGGWTSSNYAALACPDFPMCQNTFLPKMDFVNGFNVMQHIGPNYLGGMLNSDARTAIHITHRLGAILVSISVIVTVFALFIAGRKWIATLLFIELVLQLALGISNIVFSLPLNIAVLHNAGGALLVATLVVVYFRRLRINVGGAELTR